MIKRLLNLGLLMGLAITLIGCGSDEVGKLRIFYETTSGKCMYAGRWMPVSGDTFTWTIVNPKSVSSKEHSWHLLETDNNLSSQRDVPRYIRTLNPKSEEEKSFLEKKRVELKNGQLVLAESIFRVSEFSLYYLNIVSPSNPFKRESDAKLLVPGGLSVCELEKKVVMNWATTTFSKSIFGKIKIISDESVPRTGKEKTFGREILESVY